MSLILDALRRKSSGRPVEGDAEQSRAEAVLATLGYSRRSARRQFPLKTTLAYGGAAVLLGFVAVFVAIAWLTPGEAPVPAARTRPVLPPQTRSVPPSSTPPASASPVSSAPTGVPAPAAPVAGGSAAPSAAPRATTPASRAPQTLPSPAAAPPAASAARPTDRFGLALYYQRVGDYANALAHYRALLEENEASAEIHNNLGLLHQDRGELDEAVRQFQRAVAIDPGNAGSHYNLAVVADEGGDMATAVEHDRAFVRLGAVTHGDLLTQVRARLAALGS